MPDIVRVVGGRLESEVDPLLKKRLYPGPLENLRHSYSAFHAFDKAHTVSLAEAGLIPLDAAESILAGLRQMEAEGIAEVRDRMGGGRHSGEAYLTELIGPDMAGWINLGRSSGDLDATAWRLVFRSKTLSLLDALCALRLALLTVAGEHLETVLPGQTCLQHAQTTTLGHTLVAWETPLERDAARFLAAHEAAGDSPAGSGIMTGSTFPLRRSRTAELLGFERVAENTRDAVLNLDILLQTHSAAAICLSNLMRIAQDLYLWSSSEFAYVELPDAYCSTSSIMPQKKNPWAMAWIRGEGSLALGRLSGVFTLLKAESDQLEATMIAAWELWVLLELLEDMALLLKGVVEGAQFRSERMYDLAAA
ncbi:MAG: lyase family protein, partial [Clostridiales bacterium]|nr:lyase family protein [Clostridiales bacterium]